VSKEAYRNGAGCACDGELVNGSLEAPDTAAGIGFADVAMMVIYEFMDRIRSEVIAMNNDNAVLVLVSAQPLPRFVLTSV
jgi:hypothetical protein